MIVVDGSSWGLQLSCQMALTGPDPGFSIGGRGPIWGGGFGLQRGHFSVKMYAKMKELGPVGGRALVRPLDPPMTDNPLDQNC